MSLKGRLPSCLTVRIVQQFFNSWGQLEHLVFRPATQHMSHRRNRLVDAEKGAIGKKIPQGRAQIYGRAIDESVWRCWIRRLMVDANTTCTPIDDHRVLTLPSRWVLNGQSVSTMARLRLRHDVRIGTRSHCDVKLIFRWRKITSKDGS